MRQIYCRRNGKPANPRTPDATSPLSGIFAHFCHYRLDAVDRMDSAVDWKLLTTEPTDTPQQVERVVDIYRRRWVIEEFFKALKTGCAIEGRQLESLHALQNATAMMLPIAWHLLAIRTSARQSPHAPATRVFNQVQLQILRKLTDRPPPDNATVADALSALAALGGHIKNNGDPGWMVLGRGYKDLIAAERVWRAATYDQS